MATEESDLPLPPAQLPSSLSVQAGDGPRRSARTARPRGGGFFLPGVYSAGAFPGPGELVSADGLGAAAGVTCGIDQHVGCLPCPGPRAFGDDLNVSGHVSSVPPRGLGCGALSPKRRASSAHRLGGGDGPHRPRPHVCGDSSGKHLGEGRPDGCTAVLKVQFVPQTQKACKETRRQARSPDQRGATGPCARGRASVTCVRASASPLTCVGDTMPALERARRSRLTSQTARARGAQQVRGSHRASRAAHESDESTPSAGAGARPVSGG